jgi:lysylphosphatidylglycerol synthetase-like protein (DUF2156 family)
MSKKDIRCDPEYVPFPSFGGEYFWVITEILILLMFVFTLLAHIYRDTDLGTIFAYIEFSIIFIALFYMVFSMRHQSRKSKKNLEKFRLENC